MALVGGLDVEVIVSTDMTEDLYSVEFYQLPGGSEFLCAVTRGFEEDEVRFLGRQDGGRLPAAFVVEAVRIAESELADRP
ncbi:MULTISPECIES: hypothetical protein [Streptomyces]|jgi:hypothetical protein|uniref:Uncharacterized protein n=1 Tax=Streptomyces spinosisporus TaxID=2927582 RepID=A0ABS9XAI4_9ACTN|nr:MULTISPECIES: hypothetical protein [Streptomyces]EPD67074.1 hypothetical protein HMPREF1211_01331 [Streptomyces sp. HGB0020]MCI3239074.1 hypothetical protein [Streptomyces spinosisporus]WUB34556.1 hypothetical protein OHN38_06395 [Streptomyces sp. NBC_00588]